MDGYQRVAVEQLARLAKDPMTDPDVRLGAAQVLLAWALEHEQESKLESAEGAKYMVSSDRPCAHTKNGRLFKFELFVLDESCDYCDAEVFDCVLRAISQAFRKFVEEKEGK